jgi:prepilin-type N-terminal cleavage/methylation domain-containing protein
MKKGFTLVEIMAVICIIALLSILVFPSILNKVNKYRNTLNDSQKEIIYNASSLYIDNNKTLYPKVEGNVYCIYISDLVSSDLLDENLTDLETDEDLNKYIVKVTFVNEITKEYEITDSCVEVKK